MEVDLQFILPLDIKYNHAQNPKTRSIINSQIIPYKYLQTSTLSIKPHAIVFVSPYNSSHANSSQYYMY